MFCGFYVCISFFSFPPRSSLEALPLLEPPDAKTATFVWLDPDVPFICTFATFPKCFPTQIWPKSSFLPTELFRCEIWQFSRQNKSRWGSCLKTRKRIFKFFFWKKKAVNDGASAKTKSYRLLVRTDAPSASLSLPPNLVLPIVVKQVSFLLLKYLVGFVFFFSKHFAFSENACSCSSSSW